MGHAKDGSGVWGHSSATGSNKYFIFALNDMIAERAFMGYCAAHGIGFKPLAGSYNGQSEVSFIVNYDKLGLMLSLGILKYQESILILGACNARDQRPASLHYLTNAGDDLLSAHDKLGVFQSVSREEALVQEAWTFDPSTGEYFICVDPNAIKLCPIGLEAAINEHCAQHDKPLGDNQDTGALITTYLLARRTI